MIILATVMMSYKLSITLTESSKYLKELKYHLRFSL